MTLPLSTWTIINTEIIEWAKKYRGPRFHNILCDPPYSLEFMGLNWDKPQSQNDFSHRTNTPTFSDGSFKEFSLPRPNRVANIRCRTCNKWQVDHPGNVCVCDHPDFLDANLNQMREYQQWVSEWSEALIANVLYPGAVCTFFGGTRTHHRLAVGLEDGGFEIFDMMVWMYSQGMAKGQNIDKAMDSAAFKAWLAEIKHGLTPTEKRLVISAAVQGGISFEERHGRTFNAARDPHTPIQLRNLGPEKMKKGLALLNDLVAEHWTGPDGTLPPGVRVKIGERVEKSGLKLINAANASVGYRPDYYKDNGDTLPVTLPATPKALAWQGYNTGLKPAWEPVIFCRAPRKGKTFVYLAKTHGSGSLNVDAGRITAAGNGDGQWGSSNDNCQSGFNGSDDTSYRSQKHPHGRWPANLALAHTDICKQIGLKSVNGITGSKNGSWRKGGQYNGGYAGADDADLLGERIGYADEDSKETVEAYVCATGCQYCGAVWAAEILTACPECGGGDVVWHCPVRMLDEQTGILKSGDNNIRRESMEKGWSGFEDYTVGTSRVVYGDSGGASRFFYAAKVSPWESNAGCEGLYWRKDATSPTGYRLIDFTEWETLPKRKRKRGNIHPTRKPIRMAEYIARIILPPGHTKPRVCIPFFGSGSEAAGVLLAAKSLGVDVEIVGIENQTDYCRVGEKRLPWWAKFDDYETARKSPRQEVQQPVKEKPQVPEVIQLSF